MLHEVRGWTLLGIGLLAACHGELGAFDTKEQQLSNCRWVPHLKRTVCNDASPTDESHGPLSKGHDSAQPAVKLKAGEHCIAAPQKHTNTRGPERYFLSIGLVVSNEANFVEEWARHYLAEGVEHFYIIDQESHWKSQGEGNKASHKHDGPSEVPFGAVRKRRRLTWNQESSDTSSSSSSSDGKQSQNKRSLGNAPPLERGGKEMIRKTSPSHPSALRPPGLLLGPTASALESALPNVTTHIANAVASAQASRNAAGWAAKHGLRHQHLSIANMPNMISGYGKISAAAKGQTKWLLMVDSDEFVFAASPSSTVQGVLRQLQEERPQAGQVSVPWMVFGSSGRMRMPRCIVPSFTHRYPYDFRLQGRDDRRRRRLLSNTTELFEYGNHYTNSSGSSYDQSHDYDVGNDDDNDDYDSHVDDSSDNSSRRRRASREAHINHHKLPTEKTKDPFHRRANGVSLAKSFVRLDALPNQAWNPTVNGAVHAQKLCPGWLTLSADGGPKKSYNEKELIAKVGHQRASSLNFNAWLMHDYVRIDLAQLRLHHYRPRAIDWTLKVKACRGFALTGGQGDPKDVGPLLENVANEDKRSTVCDPTLAHRQAMGMSSLGHPLHVPFKGGSNGGEGEESVFFDWRSHPDRALWALVEQSRGALRGDCGAWHARKHGSGSGGGRGGKWPFAKLGDGCGLDCTLPGQPQESKGSAEACPVTKEAEPPPNEPPSCPAPFKQDSLVVPYAAATATTPVLS